MCFSVVLEVGFSLTVFMLGGKVEVMWSLKEDQTLKDAVL